MCELLKRAQGLAKKKGLPVPYCPPDVRAICTETDCTHLTMVEDGGVETVPGENLSKFYQRLEAHQQVVSNSH